MTTQASQIGGWENSVVSGRFLTDFFRVLERHEVPAIQLLGDLPIPRAETGEILGPVEWSSFAEFMKRLEHEVGGKEALEACGHLIGELKPAGVLRSLAGLSASPFLLYRGAIQWAMRSALPGIETQLSPLDGNEFEIHARLAETLRPCPQIFHFATGGARALPRLLGMADAVVTADVRESEATYRVALPPSLTIFARLRRVTRSLFSAGAVLQSLEAQQLELHAQHETLQRTRAALAASEQRYRALTDAAVDVLCEIDRRGQIVYVSASVQDLLGYSPEQVTGSHYRLWVPREFHEIADARFEAMAAQPPGGGVAHELVTLHAGHGRKVMAELSVRSYETPDGEWRMAGILRDGTEPLTQAAQSPARETNELDPRSTDRLRSALSRFRARRHPSSGSNLSETSTHSHPLHRSLEALLASLEWTGLAADETDIERMTDATRRMTQIVESALVHTHAADLGADWFETQKLMDTLLVGFTTRHADKGLDLEIETEAGPAQIWGRIDLLAVGLGGLLDRVAALTAGPSQITLELCSWLHSDPDPGVEFAVRVARPKSAKEHGPTASEPRDGERPSDPSALALAIARDVAALIEGEVTLEDAACEPAASDLVACDPAASNVADCAMRILQPPYPGGSRPS